MLAEAENSSGQLAQKIGKVVSPPTIITQLPNISDKIFCGIPAVSYACMGYWPTIVVLYQCGPAW